MGSKSFPEKAAFHGLQLEFTLFHSIWSFVASSCLLIPSREVRPSYATAAAPSTGIFYASRYGDHDGVFLDAFDQHFALPSVFERKLDLNRPTIPPARLRG
jgi:hypothetical protein